MLLGLLVLLVVSAGSAITASNTVPPTRAGISIVAIGPNELKPDQCAGIQLTNLILVTDPLHIGTPENDLIIGSATVSVLTGGGGDDCIVTGNTAAVVRGGPGSDICIGPVTAIFESCETQITPSHLIVPPAM